jgi:hypothetical protein
MAGIRNNDREKLRDRMAEKEMVSPKIKVSTMLLLGFNTLNR